MSEELLIERKFLSMAVTIGKMELAQKVLEAYGKDNVSKNQMQKIVGLVFDEIQNTVNEGNRVTILGFGRFETKVRKERVMNNNITKGEKVIPAKTVPVFRAAPGWTSDINDADEDEI